MLVGTWAPRPIAGTDPYASPPEVGCVMPTIRWSRERRARSDCPAATSEDAAIASRHELSWSARAHSRSRLARAGQGSGRSNTICAGTGVGCSVGAVGGEESSRMEGTVGRGEVPSTDGLVTQQSAELLEARCAISLLAP